MKTAYCVLGEAHCDDVEKFTTTVSPERADALAARAAQNGKTLGFCLCFETNDQLLARRWAILTNMQVGARVTKITGVYKSLSHQGNQHIFYINQEMVTKETSPPPPAPTLDPEL